MQTLYLDLLYALRQLRKSPGFAMTAILTLALGIGVNTAIFSLTYAILVKSLPVPDPGRLVRYSFSKGELDTGLSWPLYDALRKRQTASTDILAWSNTSVLLKEGARTEHITAGLMSGNGFSVLGLKPSVGRIFGEADDVSGGGPAGYEAVLNYDYWNRHFNGDLSVIGRTLTLAGKPVTVIGVLPRGFEGLDSSQRADIVLPLAFEDVVAPGEHSYRETRGHFWLNVMGRLRPGESVASAHSNLHAILPQIYAEADPDKMFLQGFFKSFVLDVESGRSGRSSLRTAYSQPLLLLELLSALLLLLCCTNIGLLMMARVTGRQHELALRRALGATGSRITAHVLIEVALFIPPGLIAGVAIGLGLARTLASMLGTLGEPSTLDVSANLAVIAFSTAAALATALAAGVWPALRVLRIAPAADMKQGSSAVSSRLLGGWIIPFQVAVSVTLLVSALLLGSTFARLYLEPSGFQGKKLVFADVDGGSEKLNATQYVQSADALLAGLQSAPGIESAALISSPPLRGSSAMSILSARDRHGVEHADSEVWPEAISAGYFETMGTKIIEGRALTQADLTDRVCILSRSAAEFFFPSEDAIGHFVYYGSDHPGRDTKDFNPKSEMRVVGIAEDAHFFSLRKQPDRILYTLLNKDLLSMGIPTQVVRTENATVAAASIHNVFHKVVPSAPPPFVYTYDDLLRQHLKKERLLIGLSTSFAGVALVLVAVGLFGVLTRSVAQRTREIGIRIALGEQRISVVKTVLLSSLTQVAFGIAIGSVLAYATSRLMQSLLYQTNIASPWIYAAAGALLLSTATCAAMLPANRAASIQPSEALRME